MEREPVALNTDPPLNIHLLCLWFQKPCRKISVVLVELFRCSAKEMPMPMPMPMPVLLNPSNA